MRAIMDNLKLTVNDDKTYVCHLPQEQLDFLGYTFGRCYNRETGPAYIGTRPSKKSIKRMVDRTTQETDRCRTLLDAETVVGRLDRTLSGLGELLLPGSRQFRISDHQHPHHKAATSVVMQEAQGSRHGN